MLSNRDDNHSEHEESEYHFSDEDVSYEVEADSSKSSTSSRDQSASLLSRLSGSKRMLISMVVFLTLVFVVYKMVLPSSQAPSTDIAPQAAAPAPQAMPTMQGTQEAAAAQPAPASQQAAPMQETPMTTEPQGQTQATPNAPASPPPVAAQAEQKMVEQNPEVVVSMPAVIPVQSTMPNGSPATVPPMNGPVSPAPLTAPTTASTTVPATMPTTMPTPVSGSMDAAIASMASTNEKLINQLQADYNQRLNDFAGQAKAMQGQIETLNSRVANMEAQLNQLVQTLNRPAQVPAAAPVTQVVPVQAPGPDVKVSYSVQAIIPGRAWLRSESGETVTVAEGDTIKELGRVTKIDPYDGTVEVNTGNKVVSISYGNTE